MYQNPPRPPQKVLPTMYDLPSELVGETGLPDEFHIFQLMLMGNGYQQLVNVQCKKVNLWNKNDNAQSKNTTVQSD